jgi:hypothetical protein
MPPLRGISWCGASAIRSPKRRKTDGKPPADPARDRKSVVSGRFSNSF